jgi:glycosyltransferase involved in cell wall biosynthesis
MKEIMCSADVFVLNSTLEGMPLVLLEAMSCGLPVVTTPAGGIPELVRPRVDGIVTKGFEQEEYAKAILEILNDDDLRLKLANAGRKRVEDQFSADKIVPKYEKLFENILAD